MFGIGCKELGYFFNTVRHLRPVQIYGRIWFKLYRPKPVIGSVPDSRPLYGLWCEPARRQPSMYGPATFRFLNESHAINSARDWNQPHRDKLWLYHLHYFDDLNAEDAQRRELWHRALIQRWIRENPAPKGNGWEPYPLSLRIVNWIKWALAGNALDETALRSLAVQARYLSRRLEWHLLGNHLFANAKALVFAGLFYSGREADAWLRKGVNVLRREVQEQVLGDGGHFERSPMYHSVILEDLLDLINAARSYESAWPDQELMETWTETAQRMRSWLKTCCHPDGQIALFNDAAFGMTCPPGEVEGYARRLGLGSVATSGQKLDHLEESGYVRLRRGAACALLDVGEIGPHYMPGHAHADTLSFELSVFDHRFLVNSGTSCYGAGAERLRQRSTPAHNTVVINGEDSSEVWGGFRVARRARPFGLALSSSEEALRVVCAHSGYKRLKGKPVHWRRWVLQGTALKVHDWIEGRFGEAEAVYHFHPAVKLEPRKSARVGSALMPNGRRVSWEVAGGIADVQRASYHPEFGISEKTHRLRLKFSGPECKVIFRW